MKLPSTLREKIGQMLLIGFRGTVPEECELIGRDLREHHVGGVILFDQEMAGGTIDSGPRRRNIVSPAQVRDLLAHLQAQAAIPLFTAIDQEGGRVNRLKPDYGFPPSVSHEELGRRDDPDETHRQASLTAQTLADLGFNLNLAPVVDLDVHPDNPIIKGKGRSFSGDPTVVARHAAEFVQAHRAQGVLCCAKHFPGHGSAAGDTHLGLVDVTATWHELELVPFRLLIEADLCDVIMSAHVINRCLDPIHPATLSRAVQTGLLRDRLDFQGVLASDDLEMKAISSQYGLEQAVLLAVEAGIDVLCFGNNMTYDPDIAAKVSGIIERAVQSGRLPEARIDASCDRVLALKRKTGLIS